MPRPPDAASWAESVAAERGPGTSTTSAPYAWSWRTFAGEADDGTWTSQAIPARAQYAASEAPALPEESSTTRSTPCSTSQPTSTAVPRSLNDPLGRPPSTFQTTSTPAHWPCAIGVIASPSETGLGPGSQRP